MTTDTTTRRAVPEGWPPNTPVELMRVARPFVILAILGTAAIVGAIAVATFILHRDNASILHELRKV